MSALEDIAAERRRQVEEEGWTVKGDDAYTDGQLASAAACYAGNAGAFQTMAATSPAGYQSALPVLRGVWPWDMKWWKPKNPRRDLVRAAALIVAEIERLDRADGKPIEPEASVTLSTGPKRPADCPRQDCCGQIAWLVGVEREMPSCILAGCKHNHNPTHGGCGVDRVVSP